MEEAQSIKSKVSKSELNEVKRIESGKLTEPAVRDRRGKVKKRMYMNNSIEVACKPFNTPKEAKGNSIELQRNLAVFIKATQSPNIIQFYGLSTIGGSTVMVLEWAELGNLMELYTEKKHKIPLKQKVHYLIFFSDFVVLKKISKLIATLI